MFKVVAAVPVGLMAAVALAIPAHAGGPPGQVDTVARAIAVDDGADRSIVAVATAPAKSEAEGLAIADCQNQGGIDCQIAVSSKVDDCVAVIMDERTNYAGGSGPTLDAAREDAAATAVAGTLALGPYRLAASSCP